MKKFDTCNYFSVHLFAQLIILLSTDYHLTTLAMCSDLIIFNDPILMTCGEYKVPIMIYYVLLQLLVLLKHYVLIL